MRKFILKNKSKIIVCTVALAIISIVIIILSWVIKENNLLDIIKDIAFGITIAFSLSMTFSLSVTIDNSKNTYFEGDIYNSEKLEDKETVESLKTINKTVLDLEYLNEKMEMSHLKRGFIPIQPMKDEISSINIENLRNLKNEMEVKVLVIKNETVLVLLNKTIGILTNIENTFSHLKAMTKNPMGSGLHRVRLELIEEINEGINVIKEHLKTIVIN